MRSQHHTLTHNSHTNSNKIYKHHTRTHTHKNAHERRCNTTVADDVFLTLLEARTLEPPSRCCSLARRRRPRTNTTTTRQSLEAIIVYKLIQPHTHTLAEHVYGCTHTCVRECGVYMYVYRIVYYVVVVRLVRVRVCVCVLLLCSPSYITRGILRCSENNRACARGCGVKCAIYICIKLILNARTPALRDLAK